LVGLKLRGIKVVPLIKGKKGNINVLYVRNMATIGLAARRVAKRT